MQLRFSATVVGCCDPLSIVYRNEECTGGSDGKQTSACSSLLTVSQQAVPRRLRARD